MPLVPSQLDFNVGKATAPGIAELAAQQLRVPFNEVTADSDLKAGEAPASTSSARPRYDTTTCSSHGINIYLDVMLHTLDRTIRAGDIEQEAIEEYQKQYRDDMKRQEEQTKFEFDRQLDTALYGADHPYAKAASITPADVDKLGHDNLMAFVREHYSAANATLIIAGNFDPKQAEALVRSNFGGWGAGHKDAAPSTTPRPRTGPEYFGVVGKEEPQTTVRIVYPAPAGVDGQEAARRVLAQMLNERMEDIRFKLGSTYGTYAGHLTQLGPTAYIMGGDVDTARTGESLKAMRDGVAILQHVGAGNATQDEMNQFLVDFVRARRKLIQVLLGQSTVSSELARRLGFIAVYAQPADFYNQLLQRTAAVSPAQVKGLIASELGRRSEIIVTKGRARAIEKMFTDAGIDEREGGRAAVQVVEGFFERLRDPEEGPLLGAVLARSLDLEARRAYAAWLTARGDARAELVAAVERLIDDEIWATTSGAASALRVVELAPARTIRGCR